MAEGEPAGTLQSWGKNHVSLLLVSYSQKRIWFIHWGCTAVVRIHAQRHTVQTGLHRLAKQYSYFKKDKEDTAEDNRAKASTDSSVRLMGCLSVYLVRPLAELMISFFLRQKHNALLHQTGPHWVRGREISPSAKSQNCYIDYHCLGTCAKVPKPERWHTSRKIMWRSFSEKYLW